MKVKCTQNSINDIKDTKIADFLSNSRANLNQDYEITPGREYQVFWVDFDDSYPFYYVFEDDEEKYPLKVPSALFEKPTHFDVFNWSFCSYFDNLDRIYTLWGPKFLAKNENFYEMLVDGYYLEETEVFNHYVNFIRGNISNEDWLKIESNYVPSKFN